MKVTGFDINLQIHNSHADFFLNKIKNKFNYKKKYQGTMKTENIAARFANLIKRHMQQ